MFRKILFSTLMCLLAITMFSQDEMDPLENALSGIVTVGVFDVSDNDLVLGFGSRKKTYAEIAYEQTLNMGDAFSNGSGFVVDFGGKYYILTNVHVIDAASGQAGSMFVFSISRAKYPVKLVGGDSFYDIAILEFDGVEPGPEIHPLQFSEEEVRLAQKVYAIGNPLGAYPYSITEGIISGKNRQFYRPTTGRYGFLQHTATLIWGNSGGPLVNEAGKVVGINTWVETRNKGGQNYLFSQLNFALEGRKAQKLAQDILGNGGRLRRAFLGVEFATTSNALGPDSPPFIKTVFEGSPAYEVLKDRAGFTVSSINGQAVQTLQDIVRILEESAPGEQINFGLKKGILSPVDSIKAAELTAARLEQVAHHFFQSYSDYDVQEDAGGVVLSGKPGKTYLRLEQMAAAGEGESGASFEVIQGKESYGLAGLGGIDKLGQLSLYRANTVHELGAVIRLSTLEGHLGASLVEGTEYAGTVRFYTEDSDFNEIKILFY
ncbi:MAG: trypsin-like peptidase domain-containing protein [Phaeodactylibacter sp.]|nr:trypsin-like peptidase domain-containing protein [Phaeodactylibacter sp.]MCB9302992.1 trypsin-like peptidase domain-containing protein [Lewinellaceae bacterium]